MNRPRTLNVMMPVPTDPATMTIPAFSLAQGEHGEWVVNLHDFVLGKDSPVMIKVFHDEDEALRFIAEHKAKLH